MTDQAARPTIYLKRTCPFCLKLRIFLTEAGLADRFELVVFDDGDDMHQALRARMADAGLEPSFPAAELSPGTLVTETDALIARLADQAGVDVAALPLLDYYSTGLFTRYRAAMRELREMKLARSAAAA